MVKCSPSINDWHGSCVKIGGWGFFAYCVFPGDNTALHWSSHNITNITVTAPFPLLSSLTKNNWPTSRAEGWFSSEISFWVITPGLRQLLLTLEVIYHLSFFFAGCWVQINQKEFFSMAGNTKLQALCGWLRSINNQPTNGEQGGGAGGYSKPRQEEWPGRFRHSPWSVSPVLQTSRPR